MLLTMSSSVRSSWEWTHRNTGICMSSSTDIDKPLQRMSSLLHLWRLSRDSLPGLLGCPVCYFPGPVEIWISTMQFDNYSSVFSLFIVIFSDLEKFAVVKCLEISPALGRPGRQMSNIKPLSQSVTPVVLTYTNAVAAALPFA